MLRSVHEWEDNMATGAVVLEHFDFGYDMGHESNDGG